jgi:phospholipid transport system substrate-binding protein
MRRWLVVATIIGALAASAPRSADAGVPTDQIRSAVDRVLKLVQDPELRKPANAEARRKQIREVANEVFDWEETGKRALGLHWRKRTPAEQQEFSALFADLIERSYVNKIEAYSGERIVYLGDTVEGNQATVRTKLVTKSNTEIPIDYRLQKEGERWRAYDVLIESVSLVSNYRSQFNRIIQQSGYDDLMRKMRAKQEELSFEEAERGKKKP